MLFVAVLKNNNNYLREQTEMKQNCTVQNSSYLKRCCRKIIIFTIMKWNEFFISLYCYGIRQHYFLLIFVTLFAIWIPQIIPQLY